MVVPRYQIASKMDAIKGALDRTEDLAFPDAGEANLCAPYAGCSALIAQRPL